MKASLRVDGSLELMGAAETRVIRPSHQAYQALMRLYQQYASVALSSAHAPAGYTHEHPLVIAGHSFTGGQFIPAQVVAEATAEEKESLEEPGPGAKGKPEHRPPPGFGGHPWMGGTPERDQIYRVPIEHLHRDPGRFQFKQGTNKKGVTGQFADVQWNPDFGGVLSVWQDPSDGQTYVINGHHRLDLAERSNVSHLAVRYLSAKDAHEARAAGALINIAEGKATALDIAKFMRDSQVDPDDLIKRGVSLKSKTALTAIALAKLDDELFDKVVRGDISEEKAIADVQAKNDAPRAATTEPPKPVAKPFARATKAETPRPTPLAKPFQMAPVATEDTPKSKGHVAFIGKHEFYRGSGDRLYKAKIASKILPKTGNRNGDISSDAAMERARAEASKPKATRPAVPAPKPVEEPVSPPASNATTPSAPDLGSAKEIPAVPSGPPSISEIDALPKAVFPLDQLKMLAGHIPASEGQERVYAQALGLAKERLAGVDRFIAELETKGEDTKQHLKLDQWKKDAEVARRAIAAWKPQPPPEPKVTDEQLETASRPGPGGGVRREQQLGSDAGPAPETLLPETGRGTEGGLQVLPDGHDVRRDAPGGETGGSGDADEHRGGTGARAVAPEATGGAGTPVADGNRGESGGDPAGRRESPREQSLHEPATPANPTDLAAGNFRYGELDFAGKGLKTKFRQNIEAIRTLRAIELEGRATATPAEQEVMAKYVGWGQFPGIFKDYGDEGYSHQARQEWQKEAEILRSLLSEDEWRKARGSILNAHYTHPDVVKAHWQMAQRLGFEGGRFLEPSGGIGYYLGMMPPELASRTHATAVELDTITGKMLKLMYPSANVNVQGFEGYEAPDHFFDLVASNVPFGDYGVHHTRYNKHQANIHDFFFLKSIDHVRPGGLVMHVTSTGTMDKGDSRIREEIARQCDLVSAIRFPGSAHKENAGTEVVTDLLILRKRAPGEKPSGPDWMDTVEVPCPASVTDPNGGAPIPVNRYFAEHPEQVLGRLDRTGTMYAGDEMNVTRTDDYEQRLASAIERLPQNIMSKPMKSAAFEPEALPAPGDVRPGGYTIKAGKLYRSEEGVLRPTNITGKNLERIKGHVVIRDAAREVINDQTSGRDASASRAKLNEVYDAYVKKFGFLNDQANKRAFRADPDAPLVRALEKWNNDTKSAAKSDMFSRDTIRRVEAATHADTIPDALASSLHEHGRIDVEHMAKLLGQDAEHVKAQMVAEGVAYEDPSEGFQPADQYLSGNVRRKLALARAAAASDPKYQVNVAALEKVQPEDIDHTEITARLGANWIPGKDIAGFAAHLLSGKSEDFDIRYVPEMGEWQAHYTSEGERRIKHSATANSVWGVELDGGPEGAKRHVAGFMDLLKSALSGRSMVIRKTIGSGKDEKEVVDQEATDACRAKVQELKDAFAGENGDGWLWEDDARRERLVRYYNDNFNNIRPMKYDGSHLKFPGMNPAFKMRSSQADFVWQVITTGKGLAAHEVGTGKTPTLIAAAMETRRLGLAKKPCLACLKANIEDITADVLKLYPGAKVLSTADMFTADKRKQTIAQIATGDYDIVLMTHDNLNMLQMRPTTVAKYIEEELSELRAAKMAAEKEAQSQGKKKGRNSHSVKALEKAEKNLEAKLKEALDAAKKDDAVYFEDLGIDLLLVDEAHRYKTLPVYTKKDRVKGVPSGRSQRATNMLMRTRWLQEQNGGRGVIFATGTPISNTMAEMYTMQRYLQPEALKERGIDKFDAWANLFGDEQTKVEVSVAGEYKPTTRFSKFVNVPELMQIARQVIDVRRADDIKNPDGTPAIKRPKRHDHVVVAPHSDAIVRLMKSLKERADAVKHKHGPPQKGDDNMLAICTDGRKGALDIRLVDPSAPDDPESKTNQAIANILRIAQERPGQVQLIFSDVGVNPMKVKGGENAGDDDDVDTELEHESDVDATGLRWYGDVIDKLVKGGIPREKIADFSTLKGQAKEDAQAALRRGDMLIGIGSTEKMGTGVNVQNKIAAMHHLDVPWVPASIEQRDGRGWRHGNENADVEIYRYVTEGSLDQMFWQVVGTKADFIKSVMTPGGNAPRVVENGDTEQLSPEQIAAAASGDPRLMQKVNLEDEVKQLRRAQARHDKEQAKLKRAEADTLERIEETTKLAVEKAQDADRLKETPDFELAIGDTLFKERKEAEEAFQDAVNAAEKLAERQKERSPYWYAREEQAIGRYRGLQVYRSGTVGGGKVFLKTASGKTYPTSGTLQGIEAIARMIETRYPVEAAKDAQQAQNDLVKIRAGIGKTFAKADLLKTKAAELKAIEDQLAAEHAPKNETTPSSNPASSSALPWATSTPAVSMSAASVSEDVRTEALRALRAMFPLSDYANEG